MSETRKTTEQEQNIFQYLNDLRDSGSTNMYAASSNIVYELGVTKQEARTLLSTWMQNFQEDGIYETIKA